MQSNRKLTLTHLHEIFKSGKTPIRRPSQTSVSQLRVAEISQHILSAANDIAAPIEGVTFATSEPVHSSFINVIGTGGTIAGTAASSTQAIYAPSQLNVASVINGTAELKNLRQDLRPIDLYRVNSEDMTSEHWLMLAKKVNEVLQSPDCKGVVITHGTDTLEETAYFLNLVVKSDKPVVVVGAMRAATSLSADGPLNLYNAIAVIASPDAIGRGVMVMLNDTIYDARDVTKTNTTMLSTFNAPNSGPIGHVNYGNVEFSKTATRKHTSETTFDITGLDELPVVEILYEHAGSTGNVLKAIIEQKPAGIVIAGVGDGNLHIKDRALLKYASEAGIHIVRSSRTGSGKVTETNDDFPQNPMGTIAGDNLNPQHARILLMLSLTQTKLAEEIRHNFRIY